MSILPAAIELSRSDAETPIGSITQTAVSCGGIVAGAATAAALWAGTCVG